MHNLAAATLADSVYDLFICKHAFAGGAPVYIHFFFIGKSVLEELNENPLSPLIIIRIGSVDFTAPIKGNAERLNLLFKAGNILLCNYFGINVVFDCVVLGRKSESVPADRIKTIVALKSALS